jgi:hypothetical protein
VSPPLFIATAVTRNGPALRRINPDAVAYAMRVGGMEYAYPGSLRQIRAIAPPSGGAEAQVFLESTGLHFNAIYIDAFGGEVPTKSGGLRWLTTALGLAVGAFSAGLGGALLGGAAGWLLGKEAS